MSSLSLITVGKLKDESLKNLEQNYLKRITKPSLNIFELRSLEERLKEEAQSVLKKVKSLPKGRLVLLTEKGQSFDSSNFSKWLYRNVETHQHLIFVIAGASGYDPLLFKEGHETISLGQLTYPHQFARILLVEQIYRAQTIKQGHPYHK